MFTNKMVFFFFLFLVILTGLGSFFAFSGRALVGYSLLAVAVIPLVLCFIHCFDERSFNKSVASRRRPPRVPTARAIPSSAAGPSSGYGTAQAHVQSVDIESGGKLAEYQCAAPSAPAFPAGVAVRKDEEGAQQAGGSQGGHNKKKKKGKKNKNANQGEDHTENSHLLV
jgi:hypothetical protein